MVSRRFVASIAIAGAVTALAACGSDSGGNGSTTSSGTSTAGSKGATCVVGAADGSTLQGSLAGIGPSAPLPKG